jgi:hypothetical protein
MTVPNLKRNRECGDCKECCTGTLHADIYGKIMDKGRPCHYLGGEGCTIYEKRPGVCKAYQCEWLRDDSTLIPEWMRPDLSKVIITQKGWGDNLQHNYWNIAESHQKIDSVILNWVYMFTSSHNICANIEVDGRWYQMGPPEFVEYMQRSVSTA